MPWERGRPGGRRRCWGLGKKVEVWHGHRAYWLRMVSRQGSVCSQSPRHGAGARAELVTQVAPSGHTAAQGSCWRARGASVGQCDPAPDRDWPGFPGAPPHPLVPVVPQLWPSVLRHSLSGTRISQGTGMVGLLSLMSITTTVSVAEPISGGVPRSIAVTTRLWAGMRVRCVSTHEREHLTCALGYALHTASHLGHELQVYRPGVCVCGGKCTAAQTLG